MSHRSSELVSELLRSVKSSTMGRQKQNKPRRERHESSSPSTPSAQTQKRVLDIAGMLDLSAALANGESGVVLEVAAVEFAGDGYASGDTAAFVRLTDGATKLLPLGLRPWARETIDADLALRASGEGSVFPCRIEFGVSDGEARAVRVV